MAAKKARRPAEGAVRSATPRAQAPQLATLATTAPIGENWISEVKFDDYRLLVAVDGGKARLPSGPPGFRPTITALAVGSHANGVMSKTQPRS